MSKVNDAVELFRSGCACSQAILAVYGEQCGIDRKIALRLAAGFAAGMRMGETCGAVTGAMMVLGLRHCQEGCEALPGRQRAYLAVNDFVSRFKNRKGTIICNELLGCSIGTAEGMQKAQENGLFQSICPGIVQTAGEILEEMSN